MGMHPMDPDNLGFEFENCVQADIKVIDWLLEPHTLRKRVLADLTVITHRPACLAVVRSLTAVSGPSGAQPPVKDLTWAGR